MAEVLSPSRRQRIPVASPTSPFFLGSNDDRRERAQAREARAAAIRRKVVHAPPPNHVESPCLCKDQILELLDNCIKLASENVRTIPLTVNISAIFLFWNLNLYYQKWRICQCTIMSMADEWSFWSISCIYLFTFVGFVWWACRKLIKRIPGNWTWLTI